MAHNKRIKGTKPVGHESGISLLLKLLATLTIGARILAPYAQGRYMANPLKKPDAIN